MEEWCADLWGEVLKGHTGGDGKKKNFKVDFVSCNVEVLFTEESEEKAGADDEKDEVVFNVGNEPGHDEPEEGADDD